MNTNRETNLEHNFAMQPSSSVEWEVLQSASFIKPICTVFRSCAEAMLEVKGGHFE